MKAGLIRGMECAFPAHPAEPAGCYTPVIFTVPRATPALYLDNLFRGITDKRLYGILVCKIVAPFDGVIGMEVVGIILFQNRCTTAFCCNRVTAHRVDLGDYSRLLGWILFGNFYGSTKAGAASANYQYVM